MERRKLPSEHETDRLKAEARARLEKEAADLKARRLRAALNWLVKQEAGRVVWAYLFEACGWHKSSLARLSNNDIAVLTTECKEAQRNIYLELRKHVDPELLFVAEYEAEFGPDLASKIRGQQKGEKKNA